MKLYLGIYIMKKRNIILKLSITLLLLFLFFPMQYAQSWTKLSPYPSSQQISDLYFYNSSLGFAPCSNGFLLRTSDAGINWTEIYCGHVDVIQGIFFTSASTGYACGYEKMIIKTTDGGLTWTDLAYSSSVLVCYETIVFSDANTGWVAGDQGLILKTTNAGASWTTQTTGVTSTIEKILYIGSNKLIAFCGGQYILRTTDGGSNWSQINTGTIYSKIGAQSPDNINIFASCTVGYFSKSTDAGLTWTSGATGVTTNHIWAIHFTSATTGFIGDETGKIWKTTNSGTSWIAQTSGTNNGFLGICFTDANTGFAGGTLGTLITTTNAGTTWTSLNRGVAFNIYAGAFSDANTGYVCSGDGAGIYKTTNGGTDWFNLNVTVAAGGSYDFMLVGTNTGFGCGSDASYTPVFFKTTNAGTNWSEVSLSSTAIVSPGYISFPTTSAGFISDYGGMILDKTTDGGSSWIAIKSDFPQNLMACYFLDANNGYVTGAHGYVTKTSDGGTTWSAAMTTNTIKTLNSIVFLNSNLGFACGDSGTIIKTTNGGNNWTNVSVSTTSSLYRIKFVDAGNILTCGAGGKIFLSNNAGSSWNDLSISIFSDFYTIGLAGSSGWVLGSGGGVYKNNVPLPVQLSSFTASVASGIVTLNWQTATEVNNFGFEIERAKVNNSNGSLPFVKIGFVQGHGSSNSPKKYSFIDNTVSPGNKYSYRLKNVDNDGSISFSKIIDVQTGVIPNGFLLNQNFPNPFNPSTTIEFAFAINTKAELNVYDILGNKVAELFNNNAEAGKIYEVQFKMSNLSSGVYFYKLTGVNKTETKKMLLLK